MSVFIERPRSLAERLVVVRVRLTLDGLATIDERAEREGVNRSDMIRALIQRGLDS